MKHQREKTKKEKRDRKKNVPERKQILFWNPSWTSLDTLMSSSKTWEGSLKKGMKMIKTVDKRTVALIWYFWGFNGHESFHKMRSRKENNRFSSKSTFKVLFQIKARTYFIPQWRYTCKKRRHGFWFNRLHFTFQCTFQRRAQILQNCHKTRKWFFSCLYLHISLNMNEVVLQVWNPKNNKTTLKWDSQNWCENNQKRRPQYKTEEIQTYFPAQCDG